jgi:multidrug resistance protein, MATE family
MLKKEALHTIKLSGPIILGELTQMSLGLINSAMVGHLGYHQLAAASLVNGVLNIPYVFGIGMTMSISQTVATAHGQQDRQKISHYLFNGLFLSAITAIIISLIIEIGNPIVFHLGQDQEVAKLASPYLRLMGFSVIPMLLFFALKQFTDGLELTRTAMMLSMLSMPLNVLLDWTFIFGHFGFKSYGLIGAGFGTLITRTLILIALAFIIFFHKQFKGFIAVRKHQWHIKWLTQKEMMHIGVPSSIQAILEVGAFAVSGILVGTFGAVELAAHQIAIQLASFTFMVSLGLAQGSSIRIGNAFGRKDWNIIQNIGKSTYITGLMYGVFCAILFILMRNQLPHIFTKDFAVLKLAGALLFFAAVFQISDATQAIGVGVLRGIKDVKAPTIFMTISYWALGIPLGWILAKYLNMGVYGIWIGFVIGLTFTAILLFFRFKKIISRSSK